MNNSPLFHKIYGQGPPLIILHGLLGSLDNWVSHARKLQEDFTVFLLDQRNHGRSAHLPEFDYLAMAEDLFEFMDSQSIFQAHLLGHSMGGKTVMKFADLYPERIDKLIVADIAPKAYSSHHDAIFAALNNVDLASLEERSQADSILARGIKEVDVRQFLLKSLARDRETGFRWKFNLPVITRSYENILEQIELEDPFEGPTLFLSGGKSNYVSESDHPMIRDLFPGAQFATIPQAGHWLHADAPGEFLSQIKGFLTDSS